MLSAPTRYSDDASNSARAFWLGRVSEAASALASTRASERLDANCPAPRSPMPSKSRIALLGGLVGVVLAATLTAFVAIEQFPLAHIWHQLIVQRAIGPGPLGAAVPNVIAEFPAARLVARPRPRVMSSGPIPLGLAVEGRAEDAVVIITGLLPGMEVSEGDAASADAWRVSVAKLGHAWIAPPDYFGGSVDLIAELRLPDDKIADRLAIRLEWASSPSPPPMQTDLEEPEPTIALTSASAELRWEETLAEPVLSPPPVQQQPDREESPPPELSTVHTPSPPDREEIAAARPVSPAPALPQRELEEIAASPTLSPPLTHRQLDQKEIPVLLTRGKNLIASGDFAAARVVLRRAAEANNAEAALALAATYDPFVFRELKVYGLTADPGMAGAWYEKANKLGSSVAQRRLEILTQGTGAR
jgi:hypothetical protein